jgi:TonB family protein
MFAVLLAVLIRSTLQVPIDREAGFTALITNDQLEDWQREHLRKDDAFAKNGVMHVVGASGWVHTRKSFADFVLRFDVRAPHDLPSFTIVVRGGAESKKASPNFGYGVRVQNGRGSLVVYDKQMREYAFTHNDIAEKLRTSQEWQAFELWCAAAVCRLEVNGGAVASLSNLEIPLGNIGFSADTDIELRNIRVRRVAPISDGFAKGAYLIDDPELKPPRPTHEAKPQYTPRALAQRIEGAVLMAAVVKEDGSVGDIAMLRSLDSQYGLDHAAIAAAKQWRFTPAMLRGERVPTLVTVEMSFKIR